MVAHRVAQAAALPPAWIAPMLPRLARHGLLGIGVPAHLGGEGGNEQDVADALAQVARESLAAAQVFAAQRHFIEVLLRAQNIGLAEYRLPALLAGEISGACTATWPEAPLPPLTPRDTGRGWRLSGSLHAVPNVGRGWYLVSALVQAEPARAPLLVLLSSEQDGLRREALPQHDPDVDVAAITAAEVYFREDEILHEDANQVAAHLSRFAVMLRGAMRVGQQQQRQGPPVADIP